MSYLSRYLFAALGSATVLPAVEHIGVGWFSTVSAGFLVLSALMTGSAVKWGKGWRDEIDGKRREKRKIDRERFRDEDKEAAKLEEGKERDMV